MVLKEQLYCSCIYLQVGEEVERALAKFAPPKVGVRYVTSHLIFFHSHFLDIEEVIVKFSCYVCGY